MFLISLIQFSSAKADETKDIKKNFSAPNMTIADLRVYRRVKRLTTRRHNRLIIFTQQFVCIYILILLALASSM